MPNQKNEVDSVDIILMLLVASFFDLVSLIPLMNWVVWPIAWMTFFIWFKIKNISFTANWKKLLTVFGVSLIEIIPILSIIPSWIALVIITIVLDKAEKNLGVKISSPSVKENSKFNNLSNKIQKITSRVKM